MRDRLTAGLLALFLGGFGIHRFYLGQITKGILYAVFSMTGIPFVLGFIDAILLLVMPKEVFDAKYNQDVQVLQRNRQRKQRAHKRQNRRSNTTIKRRHRVQKDAQITSRDLTTRAKEKVLFNKHWKTGKSYFKKYRFEEAEKAYMEAIAMNPNEESLLFDLACLFSMTEQTAKAYEYLEMAIHQGYQNFEEIETNPALAFLRVHEDFLDFAKAGFHLLPKMPKKQGPELLEQLRQLDILKSRGLLTELEFEEERKKLMH